jgi:multiple sugar transport system substrate-binding protein
MHTAASWVWGAGGGFISDDGKRVLFNHPKSLAGLASFYSLYREMAPQARGLETTDAVNLFSGGQAAILIASCDEIQILGKGTANPLVLANMGTALPTGIPWFGGGNLVVWRHAREHPEREKAAVALVQYLSSQKAQMRRAEIDSTLPARLDALTDLKLKPESLNRTFQQAVKTGRPYRAVPLWRRIEYQLGQELVLIREEVMGDPQANIEEILHRHLDPLARRMDLTLGQ